MMAAGADIEVADDREQRPGWRGGDVGANIDQPTKDGLTQMYTAFSNGRLAIVERLFAAGAHSILEHSSIGGTAACFSFF